MKHEIMNVKVEVIMMNAMIIKIKIIEWIIKIMKACLVIKTIIIEREIIKIITIMIITVIMISNNSNLWK